MRFPPYAGPMGIGWFFGLRAFAALVLFFLILPTFVIVPLSFTSSGLLIFPPPGWSMRWYEEFFSNPIWLAALQNSLIVGAGATVLATTLGTLAALGLVGSNFRFKGLVIAALLSPLFIPLVITAVALYFFYSWVGLVGSYSALILGHTALGLPLVIITVIATLQGFDRTLMRAGASLGAPPFFVFRRITLPLILPGVLTGAIFAFATSFDEIILAIFLGGSEQRTLPRQIFSGIRETTSPAIAVAATMVMALSVVFVLTVERLRRRAERLRGVR